MEETLWTVSEVAQELRLQERVVRDRLRRHEIKGLKPGGKGRWLIRQSEVDRLLGRGETIRLAEAAAKLTAQLYTPPPGIIFISDFGGPGTHCARLERRSLDILLRDLGGSEGIRVTAAAFTSALTESENGEIHWRVTANGSLELRCPVQADPSFQQMSLSLGSTVSDHLAAWNRKGGEYLATCRGVLTQIHTEARDRTGAGIAGGLIDKLPRLLPLPPQPLTPHFGDLVYQLAVHGCQTGLTALPGSLLYRERQRDRLFSDLILGQAGIHLATAPRGLVAKWGRIHRQMIREWSQSEEITTLLGLFRELRREETAIKTALHSVASSQ